MIIEVKFYFIQIFEKIKVLKKEIIQNFKIEQ